MNWIWRRVGQALLTVFVVISLSFVLVRLMPGGPADALVAVLEQEGVPPRQIQAQVEQMLNVRPNAPLHEAYINYMAGTLQGDLGQSIWYGRSVAAIIGEVLPWTVFLMSWAVFLGFGLGISLGALMAYYEGGRLDVALTGYAMVMGSIPYYVVALVLLLIFAYQTSYFPISGRAYVNQTVGFNLPYILGIIHHAALPILSLTISGSIASLSMRGNSIRVLGEDYLRVARLRGLPDSTIALQYIARNAILPMYTNLMISIGTLFGGSVILETVFNYRGMGLVLVNAIDHRDYPLMMGAFMVITIAVVIALLFADLTYYKLDPRAETGSREAY